MSRNFSLKRCDSAQTVAILCTLLNRHLGQLGTRWGQAKLRGTLLVPVGASPECFHPVPFQAWCNKLRSLWERREGLAAISWCPPLTFSSSQTKGNPCLWPLWCFSPFWHSKKKKSGIGNEKGTAVCTQDTWPLNSNLYSVSGGRGCSESR